MPQRELGRITAECSNDSVVLVPKKFGGGSAPLKVDGEGQDAETFGCRGTEQVFLGVGEPIRVDVAEPGQPGGDDRPSQFAVRAGQLQQVVDQVEEASIDTLLHATETEGDLER